MLSGHFVQDSLQAEGQTGRQAVWTAMTEGSIAVLNPEVQATVQQCSEVCSPDAASLPVCLVLSGIS